MNKTYPLPAGPVLEAPSVARGVMPFAAALILVLAGSANAEAGQHTAFRQASPLVRFPEHVRNGDSITLQVSLYTAQGPLPNQIVKFYAYINRRWTYVGQDRTDANGFATVSPRISVPGALGRNGVTVRWAPIFEKTSRYNRADGTNGILGTGFVVRP